MSSSFSAPGGSRHRDKLIARLVRARNAKLDSPPEHRGAYVSIIDSLLDELWMVTPQPQRDALRGRHGGVPC